MCSMPCSTVGWGSPRPIIVVGAYLQSLGNFLLAPRAGRRALYNCITSLSPSFQEKVQIERGNLMLGQIVECRAFHARRLSKCPVTSFPILWSSPFCNKGAEDPTEVP